ncbi:MAG TPA: hypothetical protein VFP97_10445 [Chitinophagaceae bacterium]|nr:hypothetical protein [Chitinophagaceae bacterium]
MQKTYDLYKRGIAYWYLLLIPLIGWGFYQTYFASLFAPRPSVIHIHFALMMMWAAMLITQPLLIRYKKLVIHRTIGKISYVVMPLLLITGFLLARFVYYRELNSLNLEVREHQLSSSVALQKAADSVRIILFYLFWLGFFYFNAVLSRRTTSVHARYMVAASLTMIGPTLERILFFSFGMDSFFGRIPIEVLSYLLQDLILAGLLIYDYKNRKPTRTLWLCLLVYMVGQFLYFFVKGKSFWEAFVSFIMQPAS